MIADRIGKDWAKINGRIYERDAIDEVRRLMARADKLQIGRRVRVRGGRTFNELVEQKESGRDWLPGRKGTVVDTREDGDLFYYGVEFDKRDPRLHNLEGRTLPQRGMWLKLEDLEPLERRLQWRRLFLLLPLIVGGYYLWTGTTVCDHVTNAVQTALRYCGIMAAQ